jgi:hypothetical protein
LRYIFVGSGIDNKHRARYCCAATRAAIIER